MSEEAAGAAAEPRAAMPWRAALSGMAAVFVGIGLGRFAYGPLIPALIEAVWLSPAEAAYLGAINLAGYVAGAAAGPRLGARLGTVRLVRAMMLTTAASLLACGWPPQSVPGGVGWFAFWRLVAGVAGGLIMVNAAPCVLAGTAPERRGLAGGIVFTGIGAGIAASATLLPFLLAAGLPAAWRGLGLAALALAGLAWLGWPRFAAAPARVRPLAPDTGGGVGDRRVWLLFAAYGLNAAGLVPHMLFIVDYVVRGLGQGIAAGSLVWVLYGIGAAIGPVVAGYVGDRLGFGRIWRAGLVLQGLLVLLPALTGNLAAIALSAVAIGAFSPATIPMLLGRAAELVGSGAQAVILSRSTVAWGLMQTGSAYALSFLFAHEAGYPALFAAGAGCLALGFAVELAASHAGAPGRPPQRASQPRS